MDEAEILDRINELTRERKDLCAQPAAGGRDESRHQHLQRVEADLDRCWGVLRRRRARR
jgi:hypothetical protein